ncbi:hypothetical protein BABINDRAFT_126514 [Babjeviella inositovora NRRL Y-12698]|uniref:Uncharacterized protein n=1 Tax=Babjeviella inositovora NRRL Y-12698 TaxID=984486 RepID=A0A1E3QT87_9ASCO|nr:uncharacterized protein BABINDRAFT_126514 [Babjeviella inositovora NRRL Y-12698]ODQ80724.1 hypothetical protein BABINDRAFT_126514 [Babjeviella inositovora NRRL Y-12698]
MLYGMLCHHFINDCGYSHDEFHSHESTQITPMEVAARISLQNLHGRHKFHCQCSATQLEITHRPKVPRTMTCS